MKTNKVIQILRDLFSKILNSTNSFDFSRIYNIMNTDHYYPVSKS